MADQSVARPVAAEQEARRVFELQHAASRREPIADAALRRAGSSGCALWSPKTRPLRRGDLRRFRNPLPDRDQVAQELPTVSAIRHARKHVARWMRPERRRVDLAVPAGPRQVRYEPLGVIGIISPVELPAPARCLAAGRGDRRRQPGDAQAVRADAAFSELLSALVAERFDGPRWRWSPAASTSARPLRDLPFDHLLFTGSTAIGRKVYVAAAANLAPVTLELGGKSPAIVGADFSPTRPRDASPGASSSTPARPASLPTTCWCPLAQARRLRGSA